MGLPEFEEPGAASSNVSAWDRKIPETVLDLYLNSLRNYPAWRRICPSYVHADIQETIELAYNNTLVRMGRSEYVFTFTERTTSLDELGEDVTTGQLEVRHHADLVFRVGASYSPTNEQRAQWTPRTVELFVDGDWVEELSRLWLRLREHEQRQMQLEKQERDQHTNELFEIRRKLGANPSRSAPKPESRPIQENPVKSQDTIKNSRRPWWRGWGSKNQAS